MGFMDAFGEVLWRHIYGKGGGGFGRGGNGQVLDARGDVWFDDGLVGVYSLCSCFFSS